MAVAENAKPVELAEEQFESRSLLQDSMRRLLRNRVAIIAFTLIGILVFFAIFADVLVNAGLIDYYGYQHRGSSLADPLECSIDLDKNDDGVPDPVQFCFLFGADRLGRDLLSRTIYGARVSLLVGVVGSTVSLAIGTVYGVTSGYYGGRIDNLMMRVVDFLYGLPVLIVVILMQVYFKSLSRRGADEGLIGFVLEINQSMGGLFFVFVALGAVNWLAMARVARGQTLSVKQKEYVEAAKATGVKTNGIIFKQILPNILGPCIVQETLQIPSYILFEAFLSFIGLGVDAPTPSWGIMINEAYQGLRSSPHALFPPAAALTLTVLAFNFLGDGLRDAFDPRLRE